MRRQLDAGRTLGNLQVRGPYEEFHRLVAVVERDLEGAPLLANDRSSHSVIPPEWHAVALLSGLYLDVDLGAQWNFLQKLVDGHFGALRAYLVPCLGPPTLCRLVRHGNHYPNEKRTISNTHWKPLKGYFGAALGNAAFCVPAHHGRLSGFKKGGFIKLFKGAFIIAVFPWGVFENAIHNC